MSEYVLNDQEMNMVNEITKPYANFLETLKRSSFKLNDYLIRVRTDEHISISDKTTDLVKNSYGATVKYKVVYVCPKTSIPFAKELNKLGNPVGKLINCLSASSDEEKNGFANLLRWNYRTTFHFEIDPDYAEHIILDSVNEYDPTATHKDKSELFKEITKHNKSCKINCSDLMNICDFFDSLSVGTILWTSTKKSFIVSGTRKIKRSELRIDSSLKKYIARKTFTVLKVTFNDGRVKDIYPDDLHHKALYTQRPRTYKELKDLNL